MAPQYKHCLTLSPSPAEAHGVREKPLQRRGLPVWKEDSRDHITVLTGVVSGQDGPPSYSSGSNHFVHRANAPSTPPKLPRAPPRVQVSTDLEGSLSAAVNLQASCTSDLQDFVWAVCLNSVPPQDDLLAVRSFQSI
ncbi:hypothetical protein CRENBAI_005915 [Crenichthys baileyi]|uniref:Uncharacterized protein n=1 Tax=Crenichthys baileyi TaxID=28760 RepID=A0AAV9SSC2_9TELE